MRQIKNAVPPSYTAKQNKKKRVVNKKFHHYQQKAK
jgi:hypothetical protein